MKVEDLRFLLNLGRRIATQDRNPDGGTTHVTADPIYTVEQRDGKRWRPVVGAVALTREGIERYLAVNGHNLKNPRIYIASLFRVEEMKELRQVLVRLAADIDADDEKGGTS